MREKILGSSLEIHKAEKLHSKEIVSLLLSAWLYTYPNEQYQITESDIRKKFGGIDEKNIRISDYLDSIRGNTDVTYLVALLNSKVCGFLYSTRAQGDLYINALYVHPEYHRGGAGSSLLNEGITLNYGVGHIIVDVVSYNEQAIAFYRKHGFVVQGSSQTSFGQFFGGKSVPEIQMIKDCT